MRDGRGKRSTSVRATAAAGRKRSTPARKSRIPGETEVDRILSQAGSRIEKYVLKLYVAGATPRSAQIIRSVREVCKEELQACSLEVIDICQHPLLARQDQIIAIPTLIKELPAPQRRLIGDMVDRKRILTGLGCPAKAQGGTAPAP